MRQIYGVVAIMILPTTDLLETASWAKNPEFSWSGDRYLNVIRYVTFRKKLKLCWCETSLVRNWQVPDRVLHSTYERFVHYSIQIISQVKLTLLCCFLNFKILNYSKLLHKAK